MRHTQPNVWKMGDSERRRFFSRIAQQSETHSSRRIQRQTFYNDRGFAKGNFGPDNHAEAKAFAEWLEEKGISLGVTVYASVVSCPDISVSELRDAYKTFILIPRN